RESTGWEALRDQLVERRFKEFSEVRAPRSVPDPEAFERVARGVEVDLAVRFAERVALEREPRFRVLDDGRGGVAHAVRAELFGEKQALDGLREMQAPHGRPRRRPAERQPPFRVERRQVAV